MIIVAGTFRVPPENLAKAQAHFAAVVKATRAEAGNIAYSFALDVLEPGLIRVFEIYRDGEAVAAHRDSAHFKAWRESNAEIGLTDRDIKVYDAQARTA